MVVRVSELEHELSVRGEVANLKLEEAAGGEVTLASPVRYDLVVTKLEDGIARVKGSVKADLNLNCVRCLEQFNFAAEGNLDIELMPKAMIPSAAEFELRGSDLDTEYYEGDEIDLDDLIREEILLNVPLRPLCSDECKGLCPYCGKNLNIEACRCDRSPQTLLGEELKSFLKG